MIEIFLRCSQPSPTTRRWSWSFRIFLFSSWAFFVVVVVFVSTERHCHWAALARVVVCRRRCSPCRRMDLPRNRPMVTDLPCTSSSVSVELSNRKVSYQLVLSGEDLFGTFIFMGLTVWKLATCWIVRERDRAIGRSRALEREGANVCWKSALENVLLRGENVLAMDSVIFRDFAPQKWRKVCKIFNKSCSCAVQLFHMCPKQNHVWPLI